ncbi:MAG TPA: SAM-dependent methyltransferase, partial [Flavobacteriales bacterium]|nr:SAM-dependent methyltransferase [Flavobacteriales bacterium]
VLSEAGAPAIADPGASLLALAHDMGIPVVPIPGPSAIMLSIMGSGLNGQQFTFHGYLPIDKIARTRKLRELEQISFQTGYAQFFIETPYRNTALLEDCFQVLNPATRLCIGVNLTLQDGWIRTIPVSRWKQNKPAINKLPAVFGILKSS